MKRPKNKKDLERIAVDRKIVEGLRDGRSLTSIARLTGKGKGYVLKVRDLALDAGLIEYACAAGKSKSGRCRARSDHRA